jgi:hypothetical protein
MIEKKRPKVKLVGTDGNALALMGRVIQALKKAGYSQDDINEFRHQATSGSYDHLLRTCMEWVEVY